jgi:uncharacterized protein YprB with RNaseH-like and TPR domain/predicted  nucleic acid-binding Zn-ribbon protein
LTLKYVCRKCGNNYSQEDFEKTSYCKDCGTYLLKTYSVAINPTQRKNETKAINSESEASNKDKNADLTRVAQNLRQKSETTKEYKVVVTKPVKPEKYGTMVSEGWIYGSEFDEALKLKTELLAQFEGKSLEEAIPGKILSNEHGTCYCVSEKHDVPFKKASPDESRRVLLSELRVLPGIGPARERTLKQQGCRSIEALTSHAKWRKPANEYLRLVESKDVSTLQSRLRRSLPKSHPLAHYLAGFCRNEDFAIIDIETMGLFGRPIILVGAANVAKKGIRTRQFLVRDVSEEVCALWEFASNLKSDSVFVSFNGRRFDVPFIRERLAFYGLGLEQVFENPHFDVLHFARRALGSKLANCRLETVEKYLGIQRGVNIPGALVPEFYDNYQRSGNVGPLVAIVEHNKQDLVTLAQLFCSLYQEWKL